MTSRYTSAGDFEGYGIAVLEAALCGKPAVVAANSGLLEAIVEGETGLSVPENDPARTADAIVSLLSNREHRMKMGNSARKQTLEERTWKHRTLEYDSFLRSILYRSDSIKVSNPITDLKGS
jgi:phosphatidylinositol alpha-1,6-mannosyltransferase